MDRDMARHSRARSFLGEAHRTSNKNVDFALNSRIKPCIGVQPSLPREPPRAAMICPRSRRGKAYRASPTGLVAIEQRAAGEDQRPREPAQTFTLIADYLPSRNCEWPAGMQVRADRCCFMAYDNRRPSSVVARRVHGQKNASVHMERWSSGECGIIMSVRVRNLGKLRASVQYADRML